MNAKVTGELIRLCALQLRRFDVSDARAAEIARVVERVNDAVLAAAAHNDFNDEPSRFAAVLAQLKQPAARR